MMLQSKPHLSQFDPTIIPYQIKAIKDLYSFDYRLGTHEILLSGSVGSAKSVLMAHLVVRHCLENSGARVCLGRRALSDIKETIFRKILEHISEDLQEGVDFKVRYDSAKIKFTNGSEIISRSWADKKFKKSRSLELSCLCIEELTENDDQDKEAFDELKMRVGRLPHIKQNFIICATNPDSPAHWAYKYFITSNAETRHVYYSVTSDNPFLPKSYIEQLEKDLDPKMAQRMIYGQWIEINEDVVYYAYSREKNFINQEYRINKHFPIHWSFDFNIGLGKPMSMCLFQHINDTFHVFDEVIVEGARTLDILEELAGRGYLDRGQKIIVHGDATGMARSTSSLQSDYDIIRKFLSNYKNLNFEMQVPRSNPPIRTRHNIVNAYCQNSHEQVRLYVYKKCQTVDEGLRLTALKKGGNLVEDDSKRYQHVTTALGYGIVFCHTIQNRKPTGTIQL